MYWPLGGLLLCGSPKHPSGLPTPQVDLKWPFPITLPHPFPRLKGPSLWDPVTEEAACPQGSGESSAEVQYPAPLTHPLHPGLRWGFPSSEALKIHMSTESPLE